MNIESAKKNAVNIQTAYGISGHILSANKFLEYNIEREELQNAIIKTIPNIQAKLEEIFEFIAEIPEEYYDVENKKYLVCSQNRKKLFSLQLQARLDNLLIPCYERVLQIRKSKDEKA